MTQSKSTKRALLSSVLAMLVCVAMLIGSTFAWFTDSVTSGKNKIVAGNLDVELYHEEDNEYVPVNKETGLFTDKVGEPIRWEPGVIAYENFKVVNKGNLALKYQLKMNVEDYNTVDGKSLADVLKVAILDAAFTGGREEAQTLTFDSTLSEFVKNGNLLSEGTDTYAVVIYWEPGANDNDYNLNNGKTADDESDELYIDLGVTLVATQYTYEKDSFGDDYDANAHPDAVFGASILENLKNADVTEVVAGENIDMSDSTFQTNNYGNAQFDIPDGKTLDLNNNSIVRPDGGSGSGFKFSNGVTSTVTNGYVINEGDSTAIDIEYGASATFENVTFIGHGDRMVRVRASGEVEKTTAVFKNCTFENAGVVIQGMNGATNVDIQFIDCEFTGSYYMYDEDGGNRLTDRYGNVHYTTSLIDAESNYLYGNISFDNCTFEYDATEAGSTQNVIELYGCNYPGNILKVTLNNITITAKNANPVSTDSRYADGLNLVETGTNNYTKDDDPVDYKGNSLS